MCVGGVLHSSSPGRASFEQPLCLHHSSGLPVLFTIAGERVDTPPPRLLEPFRNDLRIGIVLVVVVFVCLEDGESFEAVGHTQE